MKPKIKDELDTCCVCLGVDYQCSAQRLNPSTSQRYQLDRQCNTTIWIGELQPSQHYRVICIEVSLAVAPNNRPSVDVTS